MLQRILGAWILVLGCHRGLTLRDRDIETDAAVSTEASARRASAHNKFISKFNKCEDEGQDASSCQDCEANQTGWAQRANLAILVMTKDDLNFTSQWLAYHGHVYGFEHLYVFDGSTGEQKAYLQRAAEHYPFHLRQSQVGLSAIAGQLAGWLDEIKGGYKWMIKADTDEFVARLPEGVEEPEIPEGAGLCLGSPLNCPCTIASRVQWHFSAGPVEDGLLPTDSVSAEKIEGGRFKFKQVYSGTWFLPGHFNLGGHAMMNNTQDARGLAIVHYHFRSFEDRFRIALQTVISHGYVNASDSQATMIEKLDSDRFKGWEYASYHKVHLVLDHLRNVTPAKTTDLEAFGTGKGKPVLRGFRSRLREICATYPLLALGSAS